MGNSLISHFMLLLLLQMLNCSILRKCCIYVKAASLLRVILCSVLYCLVCLRCTMITEHLLPHLLMTNQFIGIAYRLNSVVDLTEQEILNLPAQCRPSRFSTVFISPLTICPCVSSILLTSFHFIERNPKINTHSKAV